jgi:DNA-binding transcriptional regulator YhcF (GntR family)
MGKRRNKNLLSNRRNRTSRFVRLDYRLLHTPAYRALSCTARAWLVEVAMLHNGTNNGALYLSVRDAAARLGLSDLQAASKAFAELEAMGFVVCTADAHFHVKAAEHSRARCWRAHLRASRTQEANARLSGA